MFSFRGELEREQACSLSASNTFGRGFNSRRLHHTSTYVYVDMPPDLSGGVLSDRESQPASTALPNKNAASSFPATTVLADARTRVENVDNVQNSFMS
jgi:hypothetical protein